MEPAVTAVVAFGSALLGAIAGFLGAVYIERWRIRRTRKGIVRALLGELRQNAGAVITALHSGGPGVIKFSSETWRVARFELAQFLSEQLYKDILFIYDTLPTMEDLCSHPVKIAPAKAGLLKWEERVRKAMAELQEMPGVWKFVPESVEVPAGPEEAAKKASSEEESPADKATQSE